jgi:hypothetical protein
MDILIYALTAAVIFMVYMYRNLLSRVNHMDEWLDDNFGQGMDDWIDKVASKEFKWEDDDESKE